MNARKESGFVGGNGLPTIIEFGQSAFVERCVPVVMSYSKLSYHLLLALFSGLSAVCATDSLSLRIDSLIDANQPGKIAGPASDAEFLRRIHLDLHGMIPTGDAARKFLQSEDPDKRIKLVDALMQRTEFVRHMVHTFDLMLMERRADKYVKADPWLDYLHAAFSTNQPYHQLVGDLLSADGSEKDNHAAAKFYLEREAEPSSLTRDIGRIFFGKDLQCAQCHDHPRIDDYLQSDYYGIYAFVNRLAVFRPDKKKPAMLSEKAVGDAEFKSVFTGVEGLGEPRMPGDKSIPDPSIAKGKEWKVAPDKKNKKKRPIPTYSRHAQLGKAIGPGGNRDFRRNIANRLWAHMLGTGIVEPVDFHHSSNPASHPELLALLADEFAAMNFDVRKFLRTIALTRAYQRSFAMPQELFTSPGRLQQRVSATEKEAKGLSGTAERTWKHSDDLRTGLQDVYASIAPMIKERDQAKTAVPKNQKTYDAAKKNLDRAKKTWDDRQKRYAKYFELADAARAKDPKKDDPKRKPTSAERRAAGYQKTIDRDEEAYNDKRKLERAAFAKLDLAKEAVAKFDQQIAAVKKKAPAIEKQIAEADRKRKAAATASKLVSRRLAQLKTLGELADLRSQLAESGLKDDQIAKLKARSQGVERRLTEIWSKNFAVAALVPLTPEQLGWSMMQATGEANRNRLAGYREFEKKAKDKKKKPMPNDPDQYVEKYIHTKLKSRVARFVALFSAGVGSRPTDFFASADQALFFENAGDLRGWLGTSDGTLVGRLRKQTDPKLFAEDLYLSTLTRFPREAEYQAVEEFLQGREKDLTNAAGELAWALLTSTEFRFKH